MEVPANIQIPNINTVVASLNASVQSMSSAWESTQKINSMIESLSVLPMHDWQKSFWWNNLNLDSLNGLDWLGGRDGVENTDLDENTHDSTDKVGFELLGESTDTASINAVNEKFRVELRSRTDSFLNALIKTDFENGYSNEVTEEVQSYYAINKAVTINWLNEIYSENQKQPIIITGLLRIIAMTVSTGDSNTLLPIVKCGLSDGSSEAQEASIAVIESWRTKECLDALQTTHFRSAWMDSYAKKIEKELEIELGLCASI